MSPPSPGAEGRAEAERSGVVGSTGRPCAVCRAPVEGRKLEACSDRCRTALSRQRQARAREDRDREIQGLLRAALKRVGAPDHSSPPLSRGVRTVDISALARASLPLARRRVLAMFSVYFDESGTHRASPVVVVAGWVSTDIQWRAFSTSWQKILRVAGLTPPVFHMTDFESRRPPFSDWKNSKRIKVLQRLHGQIRRRA